VIYFIAWALIGIVSFSWWVVRYADFLTLGDAIMILFYGSIVGALIPVIILAIENKSMFDVTIWRRR
jgi:hypothetical protein